MRCVECDRPLSKPAGIKAWTTLLGVCRPIGPVGPVCATRVRLMPDPSRKPREQRPRLFGLVPRKRSIDRRQRDWVNEMEAAA